MNYNLLSFLEMKILEWTQNAINLDKFVPLTPTLPSSSVQDMLIFMQQQIDFIYSLEWSDKEEKQLMHEKLFQVYLLRLDYQTVR